MTKANPKGNGTPPGIGCANCGWWDDDGTGQVGRCTHHTHEGRAETRNDDWCIHHYGTREG